MYPELTAALKKLKQLAEEKSNDRYYYQQASVQLTKALLYYQQTSSFKVEDILVEAKLSEDRIL